MTKVLIGWTAILVGGLASGVLIGRLVASDKIPDFLSTAAIFEAGLIAGILLLAVGVLTGMTRAGGVLSLPRYDAPKTLSFNFGDHLTVSKSNGSWTLRLSKLGGLDSLELAFPSFHGWHLPFTLSLKSDQIPFIAAASILLAAFAQFTFAQPNTSGREGVLIYLTSMLMFVTVVRNLEHGRSNAKESRIEEIIAPPPAKGSTIKPLLIAFSILATSSVMLNPDLTRFDQGQSWNILLWLSAIITFILAFIPWPDLSLKSALKSRLLVGRMLKSARSHIPELAVVAMLLVLAFGVRAYDLSMIPRAFGGDEGEMGSSALDVIAGRLINPFITGWFSHPTLFFFLQGFSIALFGKTVFGVRMLSVIAGTLTVLAAYLLIAHLFDKSIALIAALLLAFFSAHIHYSRLAVNNIEDGLIASVVLFLTYQGLVTRKVGYFLGAGMTLGFGMYFYQGAKIIPIILAILLVFWLLSDFQTVRSNLTNLVVMGTAAVIVSGPLLYFYYTQPSAFTSRLVEVNILANGFLSRAASSPGGELGFLIEQVRRTFLAFNLVPENTVFYYSGVPLLDPLSGMLFVFGLAYSFIRIKEKPYLIMVIWFLTGAILGGVLIAEPPTSARLQVIFVPVIFFVARGLTKLIEVVAGIFPRGAKLAWILSASTLVLIIALNMKTYFLDYSAKENFGGDNALAATEMGDYFLAYPHPFEAYVLGDVPGFIHIGTLRYIDPGLNAKSIDDKLSEIPKFVDASRDAIFVVFPTRTGELDLIRKGFPGGTSVEVNKLNGKPLFLIYQFTPS